MTSVSVPPVAVEHDVVFGTAGKGGRDLLCDVYTPSSDHGRPVAAMVMLYGGAWRSGNKAIMAGYCNRLAGTGILCVASEYRLNGEAEFPAHIHDVKAAIRWVRANHEELGIDPARIGILGRSAGGHLALLAAGTPNLPEYEGEGGNPGVPTDIAAAVGVYPPTVLFARGDRPRGATPAASLIREDPPEDAARLASPLTHVSPNYPPTFLLHGAYDKTVPPSASIVMYEALVEAGVPVELHMYAQQPHSFILKPAFVDLCPAEIENFLRRYLIEDWVAAARADAERAEQQAARRRAALAR